LDVLDNMFIIIPRHILRKTVKLSHQSFRTQNTLTHNQTHSQNCDVIWLGGFCSHRWQPKDEIKSENDVTY